MPIDVKSIKVIHLLIEKAISGTLTLAELQNKWNEEWDSNSYLEKAYNNIEALLEHAPGYFFKDGLNEDRRETMKEYHLLKIDSELVNELNNSDPLVLLSRREQLIGKTF